MLVRLVPAPAGPKPVKLGLLCLCDVCTREVACKLNASYGGTLGRLLSSYVADGWCDVLCDVSVEEWNDSLLATRLSQLCFGFSNE